MKQSFMLCRIVSNEMNRHISNLACTSHFPPALSLIFPCPAKSLAYLRFIQ
jgi:hypothetical protein